MKDLTIDNPFPEDEKDEEKVIDKTKEQETLQPKDNTMTIVLLILLTVVVGFIVWYKTKGEKE